MTGKVIALQCFGERTKLFVARCVKDEVLKPQSFTKTK